MALARGMDISRYQTVNYKTAAPHVLFVIVLATEGQRTVSDAWLPHWAGVRSVGRLAGSYHIGHPEQGHTAASEANHYVSTLRKAGWKTRRDMPPALDIESKATALSYAALTDWAEAFMVEVDELLGLKDPWLRCGFYVGDSIRDQVNVARLNEGRWYWRGGYPHGWPASVPAGCAIYQQTGAVSNVPGVAGKSLDLDAARLEDLQRMAPDYFPEDDVNLTDQMTLPSWFHDQWPDDAGLKDGHMLVQTALVSGYGHSRLGQERAAAILAQLGAMKGTQDAMVAALAALASGGGAVLDVDALITSVRQAAEDGADAAIAKLRLVPEGSTE